MKSGSVNTSPINDSTNTTDMQDDGHKSVQRSSYCAQSSHTMLTEVVK
jgi:hypothetical protein